MSETSYHIEQCPNGVLLVRIPSQPFKGCPLPDAIFTFRKDDPQYEIWRARFQQQQLDMKTQHD